MKILKEATHDNYAFWIGDGINKNLNISTKSELAIKIYNELDEEIKKKIGRNEFTLSEISQVFLDTATGTTSNLRSFLEKELSYDGKPKPYSYLLDIGSINTVITHDHSKVIDNIWATGEVHNVFEEKPLDNSNANLFKILGDYSHIDKLILTSQNIRKIKVIKLYNHFWNKLKDELINKNLVLLGVNLDGDTREMLEFVFSKLEDDSFSKFFVTSNSLSLEDESWLIKHGFKFIYEEDEDFINKFHLHVNGSKIQGKLFDTNNMKPKEEALDNKIDNSIEFKEESLELPLKIEEKSKLEQKLEASDGYLNSTFHESNEVGEVQGDLIEEELAEEELKDESELQEKELLEIGSEESIMIEKIGKEEFEIVEEREEFEIYMSKNIDGLEEDEEKVFDDVLDNILEDSSVEKIDTFSLKEDEYINQEPQENIDEIKDETISEIEKDPKEVRGYVVQNLEIPVVLENSTLKIEIKETERKNRNIRLVEFRERRVPSYKLDDLDEIDYYRGLDIKLPFQSGDFPDINFDKKEFSGKIDIKCNGQVIHGVTLKSHISGSKQMIEFKNYNFVLKLLIDRGNVTNFFYKISENTVSIKGKKTYVFFKNLLSGFELSFKNKRTEGAFKLTPIKDLSSIDIIVNVIEKYISIKKMLKLREVTLKELLINSRSLEILYSYYMKKPKISRGNLTIRTMTTEDLTLANELILSYPIGVNFLGIKETFIESLSLPLSSSNIIQRGSEVEIQVLNAKESISYKLVD